MSKPCQIRKTSGGKYCCEADQLEVYTNCVGAIKFANLPETALEYEITPDVWIPATPSSLVGTDCITVYKPGTYRFNIDCEALDGTEAPEDPAECISLCYECCRVEDYAQLLSMQIQELQATLLASDDTAANAEMLAELKAICDKLLGVLEALGALPELCDKLEEVLAGNITSGDVIEAITALQTAISEENKAICDKLEILAEKPESVQSACFETSVKKNAGYQVSDFDPGDLEVGDATSCTFNVTVEDPSPSFTPRSILGVIFEDDGQGNFIANFNWDGSDNPQAPIIVDVVLSTGETAVIEGEDFFLCSGGSESLILELDSKLLLKEFCFLGKPSIYQNSQGEEVDVTGLIPCVDDPAQAPPQEDTNELLAELLFEIKRPCPIEGELPDQRSIVGQPIEPFDSTIKFDGELASFTATGLPASLVIAPDTGIITGTADEVGTYDVVVTGQTADGQQVICPLEWRVTSEPQFANINFNHNDNGGTSNAGTIDNTNCISDVQDIVFGDGLEFPSADYNGQASTFEWVATGADTLTKADAVAANDYVDLSFTVVEDGEVTNWYQGLEPQRNSTGAGAYEYALHISNDGFASDDNVLIESDYMREPQTEGDNGNNTRVNNSVAVSHPLVAGEQYTMRYYFWNPLASGPSGSARLPNSDTPLSAGSIAIDDVSIAVECYP